MEQGVYVDVLLVLNYVINMLLIACVGKLSGETPKRRRIVAAALFGAATSLTIFLPFMGLFLSILLKLVISATMVLIAFAYTSFSGFLKRIFLLFAVSFFFAGAMLGIMLLFSPKGMSYYNGVVYFDISPLLLIGLTIIAYLGLTLGARLLHKARPAKSIYKTTIYLGKNAVTVNGFVDSGNALTEPFSAAPVIVCNHKQVAVLLPQALANAIAGGRIFSANLHEYGIRMRLIPYSNVGGAGVLPAFKADFITIETPGEHKRVEQVYVGVSASPIVGEHYNCLLHPGLVGTEISEKKHFGALLP